MNHHNKKMADYREISEKKKQKRRIICAIAVLALSLILVIVIMNFVLVVREIVVVGSATYSDEEIIKASGIKNGKNIFSISRKDVEKRLCDAFPYVKTVDIEKEYPSTLVLSIGEEYTTFYCEFEGEYFLFSYNMRVMDRFDSEEGLLAVREGSVFVNMKGISSAVKGEYIEFESKEYEFAKDVIYALSGTFFVHGINAVDITDRYDIDVDYSSRIKISFGSYIEFDKKAKNAETIMHDTTENTYGTIDVSNLKEGYASLSEK